MAAVGMGGEPLRHPLGASLRALRGVLAKPGAAGRVGLQLRPLLGEPQLPQPKLW